MTFADFLQSTVADPAPPAALDRALQALWLDARGQWDEAHALAQASGAAAGDWVHAYLHRREGDVTNAGYWYARARRPAATGDLRAEWETIARELLAQQTQV